MIIKKIAIDKLKAAEYNPRKELKPSDEEYKSIKYSLETYGYCTPIVWNESTGNIVGGHQRFNILCESGATEIEVSVVNLDETKEKELNLALNKISGVWDAAKLEMLVCELDAPIMHLMGFDDIIEKNSIVDDDDFNIDAAHGMITEPVCQLGDIWQLGEHRLMCGDCLDSNSISKLMGGAVADLVITDPPYNINYTDKQNSLDRYSNKRVIDGHLVGIQNDNLSDGDFFNFLKNAYFNMYENIKAGGALYIFHPSIESVNFITGAKIYFKHYQTLIWVKNHFGLGMLDYHYKHEPCLYLYKEGGKKYFTDDRTQSTVYEDKGIDLKKLKKDEAIKMLEEIFSDKVATTILNGNNKQNHCDLHPTMKPIKLLAMLIRNSSKPNESVLDIFGGSGSTLIACEQLNRKCYMMELEAKYCDVIIARFENLTNKKAVKLCQK